MELQRGRSQSVHPDDTRGQIRKYGALCAAAAASSAKESVAAEAARQAALNAGLGNVRTGNRHLLGHDY